MILELTPNYNLYVLIMMCFTAIKSIIFILNGAFGIKIDKPTNYGGIHIVSGLMMLGVIIISFVY